jgi:hypothetical protein
MGSAQVIGLRVLDVDFIMFEPDAMTRDLRVAGLEIEEAIEREPVLSRVAAERVQPVRTLHAARS